LVKIFPSRFIIENIDKAEQLWQWINAKIENTKILKIVPLEMEQSSYGAYYQMKGLIEVYSDENITMKEVEKILRPYPDYIQQLSFTYQ
jgi:hypothetical protein